MTHFVSFAKNAAETVLGLATEDASKVVAGAIKTATSLVPGGTLVHDVVDNVVGNEATSLAENPIAQDAARAVVRQITNQPAQTVQNIQNSLDANHDGHVSLSDLKTDITNALDSNSDGIVDGSDLANDLISLGSDIQDVVGTVGSNTVDGIVKSASNLLDADELLDTASDVAEELVDNISEVLEVLDIASNFGA